MSRANRLVCLAALCAMALPACGRTRAARAERTAELFLSALIREDYSAAGGYLDAEFAKRLPPDELQISWAGLIAATGPFRERIASKSDASDGDTVVTVTCAFEHRTMDLKLTLNKNGEITGVRAVSADKDDRPVPAAPEAPAEGDEP